MNEHGSIRLRGARQNNLRGLDVDIPLGAFTVVTGVSGSGKSSLVFDTVYAEGQRRYIETFSSYARQFLERLPPPAVEAVEGIPPAIAIRQLNPVRNSRSTVGTMTEMQDLFKQLYVSAARLFCPDCGREIVRWSPDCVRTDLIRRGLAGRRLLIAFEVAVPDSVDRAAALELLAAQGYRHVSDADPGHFRVALDSLVLDDRHAARFLESAATAFDKGHDELLVVPLREDRSEESPLRYSAHRACPDCHRAFEEPSPNLFSFNSAVGACPDCRGFGRIIGISRALVVPDPSKSLREGCIKPWQTPSFHEMQDFLLKLARRRKIPLDTPWNQLTDAQRDWVWDGETESTDWDPNVWPGVRGFFRWMESRSYKMHVRVMLSRYREYTTCPSCRGARLRPAALDWKLVAGGRRFSVPELNALSIEETLGFLESLGRETADEKGPAADVIRALLANILPRLRYLVEAGVGYLTLDRQSRTLSGGEAQRIALTTALGSGLTGTLFVLDEPSVGLHPRDIGRLIAILRRLRDEGNTILVVEHDPAVILAADRVVELGPGPGENGGRIVFQGTVPALLKSRASVSAPYLRPGKPAHGSAPKKKPRVPHAEEFLVLRGATEHNLQNLTVRFPIGRLTVVTGVSGSGKSTLVCDVLHPAVRRALGLPAEGEAGACGGLEGAERFSSVELVDQSAIGKSARSTPASYVGAFDAIRKFFAASPEAKKRHLTLGDFSFNGGKGRCPDCEGSGAEHIEMQFLSDVYLPCETCGGKRYKPEILAVRVRPAPDAEPLSIADVLELTVTEALARFAGCADIVRLLRPLADVGLGYLRLGQPVPTLSGGEAQRLKLAGFLAEMGSKKNAGASLLLFDEPTTGLHFSDIETLLGVFRRLVDAGHTLVVIEHNLQVIRAADHLIDLGPEGGAGGGRIVFEGTPAEAAARGHGATADALR